MLSKSALTKLLTALLTGGFSVNTVLSIVFLGGTYKLAVDIDLLCACVCRKYCDILKQ